MHHYVSFCSSSFAFLLLASSAIAVPTGSYHNIQIDSATCTVAQTSLIEDVLIDVSKLLQHGKIITQRDPAYWRYMDNTGTDEQIHTLVTNRIDAAASAISGKHHKKLTISCYDDTSKFCEDGQYSSTDPDSFNMYLCPAFFDPSILLKNLIRGECPCQQSEIKSQRLSSFFSSAQTMVHELMHLNFQDDKTVPAVIDCYYGPYWSAQGAKYRHGAGAYNADSYAWMLIANYLNALCKTDLDWHDADEYMYKAEEKGMGIRPDAEKAQDDEYDLCYLRNAPKIAPFTELPKPLYKTLGVDDYL